MALHEHGHEVRDRHRTGELRGRGIYAFIDDRWTVLERLLTRDGGRARLWLFDPLPDEEARWRPAGSRGRAVPVRGWEGFPLEEGMQSD